MNWKAWSLRATADKEVLRTAVIFPALYELVKICNLPVERHFHPEAAPEGSEQRQRASHKLKLCPEQYLPIIEGAIDGAIKIEETEE